MKQQVTIWEETVVIPTYEVGEPDKNPMFLEKRVYQGSTGKVYPYPVIDKIYDTKVDKSYTAVFLENEYIKVMVLPELGGRIQRAYDKTNGYDFVYYNEVIKPALVGLTGPWISGGIEFNWPQHHRPTTYAPVDYLLCENADGSKTIKLNETDQMYGSKGMAAITLYPGKAYIEIKGQLYNPTELPQTFLWWANPAVAVNDDTQSIFPPDVHAVMDHGKRAVSKFPIATGEYYKYDYSSGVDISRYKNIPVPTSYMAYHSDYDFVGGYDYGRQAGILHVADHHISPGKKQWTWGCGDFGQAWDRNLTDENGPYIELMTGVYTDNQPDFTWLKPFEEKQFVQYFMPYKQVGSVKNASIDVVMGLDVEDDKASLCVYATGQYQQAAVRLTGGGQLLFETVANLSPVDIVSETVLVNGHRPEELELSVYNAEGKLLLAYRPLPEMVVKTPDPAQPALLPAEIATNEELYLTGLHIEQYRHATYLPDPYYLEGLQRDPMDSRINTAYGQLLLRRGLFAQSEPYFRNAVSRLTWKNPNPYNSEAYFNLGLCLLYQGRKSEAFDAFYKATWTSAEQEMSFYYLAALAAQNKDYTSALGFVQRSLVKNSRNLKARGLNGWLLGQLGRKQDAEELLRQSMEQDPFDYLSRFEAFGLDDAQTLALMRGKASTFLAVAACYAEWGSWQQAANVLEHCEGESPMVCYYLAYYRQMAGDTAGVAAALKCAANASPLYCFPNKLGDIAVLEWAIEAAPEDAMAPYYLGNLWYDKRQYEVATALWEKSAGLKNDFPTVWRNLALAYFNKQNQPEKARQAMEKAFALDKTDARIFLELDQLYKKQGVSAGQRLQYFEANRETFNKRDDLMVEYITLLNLLGRHQQAYDCMMGHKFHPWEGGEGKITAQYALALQQLAVQQLAAGNAAKARQLLEQALVFPHNLGEGKLAGAKDNDIYYHLGCACEALGDLDAARQYWQQATEGDQQPAGMMFYYDQPADMILYQGLALRKLGDEKQARGRFHKLVDYGEEHLFDEVTIDYFAVSLPDLQLFDEDLTQRNKAHCHYLIALGSYGLMDYTRAMESLSQTLAIDGIHLGAVRHHSLFSDKA